MERSFYKNYFEIEKNHWLMRVRRFIVQDILKFFIRTENKKPKILDFGCGSGYFVSKLQANGYDSYGLDISSEAIQYGKNQDIKNLDVIDSHKINFPDNYFDAVLSLDVMEHLEDESWAIKEIERVLNKNGIAVVMAPAFKFLWGVQDEASHHYKRYRINDLIGKFQQNTKLEVVKKTYFNTFLFLPIAIVRILSRFLNIKGRQSDFDINNAFLNKILFFVFNIERFLLRFIKFPFGVSILLVLRKQK